MRSPSPTSASYPWSGRSRNGRRRCFGRAARLGRSSPTPRGGCANASAPRGPSRGPPAARSMGAGRPRSGRGGQLAGRGGSYKIVDDVGGRRRPQGGVAWSSAPAPSATPTVSDTSTCGTAVLAAPTPPRSGSPAFPSRETVGGGLTGCPQLETGVHGRNAPAGSDRRVGPRESRRDRGRRRHPARQASERASAARSRSSAAASDTVILRLQALNPRQTPPRPVSSLRRRPGECPIFWTLCI